jgi:hypothetical protein
MIRPIHLPANGEQKSETIYPKFISELDRVISELAKTSIRAEIYHDLDDQISNVVLRLEVAENAAKEARRIANFEDVNHRWIVKQIEAQRDVLKKEHSRVVNRSLRMTDHQRTYPRSHWKKVERRAHRHGEIAVLAIQRMRTLVDRHPKGRSPERAYHEAAAVNRILMKQANTFMRPNINDRYANERREQAETLNALLGEL